MAPVAPQHLYPAVRTFLEQNELVKTLKAFNKETIVEGEEPKKVKKAFKSLELVAACEVASSLTGLVAWDIYPVVRAFFEENELAKSVKVFDKETAAEDGEEAPRKGKKAKALRALNLVEACQAWVDAQSGAAEAAEAPAAAAEEAAPEEAAPETKKAKKRKSEAQVEEAAAEEAPKEAAEPKKKRRKSQQEETPANDDSANAAEGTPEKEEKKADEAMAGPPKVEKKRGGKKDKEEKEKKTTGERFSRIDNEKWIKTIKDDRLKDNTHLAKNRFGDSMGDSWGDAAAVDMLKVKGKGFRKEMQKKKRASWRGVGELDQGVNSIKFSDSEDE